MTTENQAILIDEAGHLDAQIKKLTPVLKQHKETLTDLFLDQEVKSITGSDFEAKARITDVYEKIAVGALFDVLKQYGKEGELFSCVTPNAAAMKKVLPLDDVKALQGESIGTKVAISFKRLK